MLHADILVLAALVAVEFLSSAGSWSLHVDAASHEPQEDNHLRSWQAPETYTYKAVDGLDLVADVYVPGSAAPHPVVVWLHGGAMIFGNRSWVAQDFVAFCHREGLILVSLEYRLAPETKLPDIVDDVTDGVRWVRDRGPELFGADANHIAVAGNSAGGYLALMAGAVVQPPLDAVVSYWGYGSVNGEWYTTPHYLDGDLAPLAPKDVRDASGRLIRDLYYIFLRQQGAWTLEVTGLDPDTQGGELDQLNPVSLITSRFPPTMLVHGLDDRDVPAAESAAMGKALERHNVDYELVLIPGAGHELAGGEAAEVAEAHRRAEAFLRRHLKPGDGSSAGLGVVEEPRGARS